MLQLPMATAGDNDLPSVLSEHPERLANLHGLSLDQAEDSFERRGRV